MLSAIIIILFFVLFIGVIMAIYKGFWHLTRKKLRDEGKKSKYLKSKYSYLIDKEFNEETKSSNKEFNEILKIFNDNGYKKGMVCSIIANVPYNDKKPWKVEAWVKKGNASPEFITIFSILDSELENLEEYNNFTL